MKTIKEWLEELPEGIKELALANCEAAQTFGRKEKSIADVILHCFYWGNEPKESNFWSQVYLAARDNKPYPNWLPKRPQENNPQKENERLLENIAYLEQSLAKANAKLCDNEEKFSDMNAELHARQVRIDELMALADKSAAEFEFDFRQRHICEGMTEDQKQGAESVLQWCLTWLQNVSQENPK